MLIKEADMFLTINLSPAQMARHLSENYGYSVSASVIVKWDNMILKKQHAGGGNDKGSRRSYSMADATLLNGIAVMRSLGYSIESIKNVFDLNLNDATAEKECTAFIDTIKEKVARQKKGLDLYAEFLPGLKSMKPAIREWNPIFKPATPEQLANREKDRLRVAKDKAVNKAKRQKANA